MESETKIIQNFNKDKIDELEKEIRLLKSQRKIFYKIFSNKDLISSQNKVLKDGIQKILELSENGIAKKIALQTMSDTLEIEKLVKERQNDGLSRM